MSELAFYRIGQDPESEATRLQQLYANEGIDEKVVEEFGSTVDLYRTLPIIEIEERIKVRYSGDAPLVHGAIGAYGSADFGMAIWGLIGYQKVESDGSSRWYDGINVSAWVLRQFRRKNLGTALIDYATQEAVALTRDEQNTGLYGMQIWTSIHGSNEASQRACEHAGFVRVGAQADKDGRFIYELHPKNQDIENQ